MTRAVRHFVMPGDWPGRLHHWRFTIARRLVQLGVLALFYGTLHAGWAFAGRPLLTGNLSASKILGTVPLADPFAVLQMLLARHWLAPEVLWGAAITLAVYLVLGGRVFCGWVCPMNIVTDTAAWLREKLGLQQTHDLLRLPTGTRYGVLALALAVSAATGVAAFDWFSPVSMLHRELLYGVGLGLTGALGILLLDMLVLRHGWCGRLCPLGAFWSLVGQAGQLKVAFDADSCTRCGDCVKVCPEPRVLNFAQATERGLVASGECTSCGRCVAICPENSLRFAWRAGIRPAPRVAAPPNSGEPT